MLTNESVEHTALLVKFSYLFRTSLFTWRDGKTDRKLMRTNSAKRTATFTILAAYLACEEIYHAYQIWNHYGPTESELATSFFKMVAHAATRVCGLGFAILAAVKADEAAYLYSQLLMLNRRFQGKVKLFSLLHC